MTLNNFNFKKKKNTTRFLKFFQKKALYRGTLFSLGYFQIKEPGVLWDPPGKEKLNVCDKSMLKV